MTGRQSWLAAGGGRKWEGFDGPFAGPFAFLGRDNVLIVDRCAVLVDVGYLLAEGGKAHCGAS